MSFAPAGRSMSGRWTGQPDPRNRCKQPGRGGQYRPNADRTRLVCGRCGKPKPKRKD